MSPVNDYDPSAPLLKFGWHASLRASVRRRRMTAVVGLAGSGKSFATCRIVQEICDREPIVHYGAPTTDISELFGRYVLVGENTEFIDGLLTQSLKTGQPFISEEHYCMPQEIRTTFLALRSGERSFVNPINGERLQIPPQWRCVFVGLIESMQCRRSAEAMRALLSDVVVIHAPPLNDSMVEACVKAEFPEAGADLVKRVVKLWNRYRFVSEQGGEPTNGVLTYRAAAMLADLLLTNELTEEECVRVTLVNQFIHDDDQWNAQQLKLTLAD